MLFYYLVLCYDTLVYHHVAIHYGYHVCYDLFKHVVMIIMINVVVFVMMYSLYD